MGGDIWAKFNNIAHINLSTRTKNRDAVTDCHKESNIGYIANVKIYTKRGDIIIK